MNVKRLLAALVAVGIAAVACASIVSAAGTTVTRQRVAIVENVSFTGGKSTFELVPLSPGPLRHDTGTVTPGGDFTGYITRNGLRIQVGLGADDLTGTRGTVRINQQIEHVHILGGYYADTGTWTISTGTGAYASRSGGGRFAAVVLPSGRILLRQEGFVRAG